MTRIAVIADVHGNLSALECVLADIARRGVDTTVNLGDCVSGPLWPLECVERIAGSGMPTVRGNHDRWVSGPDRSVMGPSDRFAFDRLDPAQRAWLGALPATIGLGDGIVAFHATPSDDNRYLVEEVDAGRLVRKPLSAIRAALGSVAARIVLCGHSHLPQLIQLPDGPLILNPGSVGCPAYEDPDDDPHVSEAGAPHARYAVLTLDGARVSVEQILLPYDWERAAVQAERSGGRGWAHGLRTGFMPASA